MSTLTIERLGNGAAYLVQDDTTAQSILLGCGELKQDFLNAGDDASGYDSAESADEFAGRNISSGVRQYAQELRDALKRDATANDNQPPSPLSAVLITDYRPEACFMLPYFTEKAGWTPPQAYNPAVSSGATASVSSPTILLTHGTRAIAPHLLAEYWNGKYARAKDTAAPYDLQDLESAFHKTTPLALKATVTISDTLKVTAYHTGHVAGGCCFYVELGTTTFLYVNGFNMTGGRVILPAEIPRLFPYAMITSSSYAVSVSETKTSMERDLIKSVHECISAGGKVVIPVYRLGFFQELIVILLEYVKELRSPCPVFVSDESMQFPNRFHTLLKRTYTEAFRALDPAASTSSSRLDYQFFDWKLLQQPGACILFTGPADISQGNSFRAIKALASDPKNLVVLSEYCTPGTVNYLLYADPQRKEINKRLGVTVSCGVHYFPCGDEVDAKSIMELTRQVAPRQVVLEYIIPDDMQFIRAHMTEQLRDVPDLDGPVHIIEMSHDSSTVVQGSRDIPIRIHKSMFNNPVDVNGLLISEGKRKPLMLVSSGNGARRLKKKKHALHFSHVWKKPAESMVPRVRKRPTRAPSSALSFLLSAATESADEDDPQEQPKADQHTLLRELGTRLQKWILNIEMEKTDTILKVRSVAVSMKPDWEIQLEWAFEDEELAGRVLGIAKQVLNAHYASLLDQ